MLPVGIHEADWADIEARLGFTDRRKHLLKGLLASLLSLRAAGCARAYLDGSFVTDKPEPGDFDLTWDPIGVDPAKLDPVLRMLQPPRVAQKVKFGGDILPDSVMGAPGAFVDFFQGTRDGGRKGIVAIDLRSLT